ncbi:MAG TPA: MarR family winged helix-turn-helix transcriptional regulator [Nevskiaceae bacterium]|nr:MarR family winged helix-turn-helix transcriptional regulator [Nevskiaceae bacterium]
MDSNSAISYLMQHTAAAMGRQSDQLLQERLGIGLSQFKILMALQHEPYIQQRKLAMHLGQTEASISRQIKLLHERGMLVTRINPKSKREHLNVPTPKGIKIAEAAREAMQQHYATMFAALNDKQQKQLVQMLAGFHAWLCPPGKPNSCNHPFNI